MTLPPMAKVRAHYLAIVTELAGLEAVEGIELDFYRHPAFASGLRIGPCTAPAL